MLKQIDVMFAMNNFNELGIQKVIITLLNNWDDSLGMVGLSVHNMVGRFADHVNTKYPIYELERLYPSYIPVHFIAHTKAYIKLLNEIKPRKVIAVNQAEALSLCIAKRYYKDFRLIVCEHCNITESIGDYKGWFGWYYRTFFKKEYNTYADVIHTVSYESKEDMVENWGFSPDKIEVIYNPALIEVTKIPQKIKNEKFTIVAASRLEKQKRIDILLEGMRIFLENHPEERGRICVKIYGDGSLKEELIDLNRKNKLEDVIEFYGFQKDPWKQAAVADLFVSTSEWEGLSVSLIEAQTVHTPILASDCASGNKEICMYGKAGKLFKKNDPNDFAEKLFDIVSNKEQLEGFVEQADINLKRFDVKTIMKQYAEI